MPGGVNSPARAFGGVGGEPIVFDRGEGAYLYDVDGNRYHRLHRLLGTDDSGPSASAALWRQCTRPWTARSSFGAPTAAENELAELIIEAVP